MLRYRLRNRCVRRECGIARLTSHRLNAGNSIKCDPFYTWRTWIRRRQPADLDATTEFGKRGLHLSHHPVAASEFMSYLPQTSAAVALVTLTVGLQSTGMAMLIHWAKLTFVRGIEKLTILHATMLIIRFTAMMIGLHLAQVMLWACFYRWRCFRSLESSFYFSAASYSTVGYGDVVLPRIWRNLGPIESLVGVLMCGLSVSLLFAIVTRLVGKYETQ